MITPCKHPMPDSIAQRSVTLPNGLRVVLSSVPRLKRCAAAVRVAAGSHDVSARWPGLAHFLEHLFFLGTERFTANDNLMAFVQRHGGQVNASTRERTTDFFFELPRAMFRDGLDRLCEMLVHPRMAMADQLREREVLHAEFIAWLNDDAARELLVRLQPLSAAHPLRGFHAGNRYSLPVPRQSFQHALQDFYRRFYQGGQITLSLAGPQSLDELEALATEFGGYFAIGEKLEQHKPPPLLAGTPRPLFEADPRRMHLTFACEDLPDGHEQAAAFLCTWINDAQAGGLVAALRDRGLIESLKAETIYGFCDQALLDIELVLSTPGAATNVSTLIFDWLTFFRSHYRQLLDEHTLLEQRRLAVGDALALARHFSAGLDSHGLSTDAVDALLSRLTPQTLLRAEPRFPPPAPTKWRLPAPNPFLRQATHAAAPSSPLTALTFSDALPATGEAAVYLRWTLATGQPSLARMLEERLKLLILQARQAGVTLAFSSYGSYWQVKASGLAEPLPAVLEEALRVLGAPERHDRVHGGAMDSEPAAIPIRQLLKALPDQYLNNQNAGPTTDLALVWSTARWMGFATGLRGSAQDEVCNAARIIPGTSEHPHGTASRLMDTRWITEASESSESALLMFYPTLSASLDDEATWRLFAQLMQAPFYQRLRVELQLGYAVFSGFRQIAGHGGLLFGVQSPSASIGQIVAHIETFIERLPRLIAEADVPAQLKTLRAQLDLADMEHAQAAEILWQAHLAGHGQGYLDGLQHSLKHLDHHVLLTAADRLAQPTCPRLCLSNRSSPTQQQATAG
jgi:coenzyme PQQ biosynthesis probable peptidase PqqF